MPLPSPFGRRGRAARRRGAGVLAGLAACLWASPAIASPVAEIEGPTEERGREGTPPTGTEELADADADLDLARPRPARPRVAGRARRFMIGLEGVAMLTPSLRPQVIELDRRYLGQTTTLGGAGIFGRWRAVPWLSLDLGVRTGSLRLRRVDNGDVVSQDLILAELGALLYLARGEIGQLAIDGGVGGLAHQIGYARGDGGGAGTQRVGAALFRVGVDIELLLPRVAFVISLRAYGVITDRRRTAVKGELFAGIDEAGRAAPVPVYQTYVIGAAGLAYRF